MKIIDVQSVAKQYHEGFYALRDLSFSVEEGNFVSIVGPFGCGKSTLLEIIAGIREGYSGIIQIKGQSPKCARLSRKVGYVFQKPVLLPWRNVIQNITLPQEIAGLKDEKIAYELLETIGLKSIAKRMPYELSGGMQQMVSVARSMILDPDIFLLDEPFSSIDEINRTKIHVSLLRIHQQTSKTMILVTHSLSEAVFLSDKIIILTSHPGKVKKIVDVNLSSRECGILFSEEFLTYVKTVKEELKNAE